MQIGGFWAEGELGSLKQDMGAKGGKGMVDQVHSPNYTKTNGVMEISMIFLKTKSGS